MAEVIKSPSASVNEATCLTSWFVPGAMCGGMGPDTSGYLRIGCGTLSADDMLSKVHSSERLRIETAVLFVLADNPYGILQTKSDLVLRLFSFAVETRYI